MQQRIQKNPHLDLFDGPDGNVSLSERKATTTTLQALFLMNSEFVHERSAATAKRLLAEATTTAVRVTSAYESIFGRPPSPLELDRAEKFLAQIQKAGGGNPNETASWASYLRGMISSNEFLFIE